MKFIPHAYQTYAIGFIEQHREAAVLLDMGLGKTVITLTALAELKVRGEMKKTLVIAPLRVARDTWKGEAAKWDHLDGLRISVAVGSEKERRAALMQDADVFVINRENTEWLVFRCGLPFDYDTLVIDELSSFKSPKAKRFKALLKVRGKLRRVIGLTGTPAANGLMDLWAEFRLLDGGQRLGRYITQYREKYFVPDKRNAQVIFSYKPKPGAEEEIYARIADITVSMRSCDHLRMPDLLTVTHPVRLDEGDRRLYEDLRRRYVAEIGEDEITASNAAALFGKLSQIANGTIYADGGEPIAVHSRKLDALEDIVEGANGKPLLLVYWFRHDLKRIEERLRKLGVVHEKLDTAESLARWNRGETEVGLIHPASAGHGLNLQSGGNTMVWYSLTWSLELYSQTVARLWRQGQKERSVIVMHILAEGTIDEYMMAALEKKDKTQSALISAVKAEIGR